MVPNGGLSTTATQTPLRRSQRRGSNNRLLDRNSRPSSARSSQRSSQRRGSNAQVLGEGAESPRLTRHRRLGSTGRVVEDEPGAMQRRGSRERVVDGRPGRRAQPPEGSALPVSDAVLLRNPGHQRRGSDSRLLENRPAYFDTEPGESVAPACTRQPLTNLSIDSSTEALQPTGTNPNLYPSRLNGSGATPYEHMSSPNAQPPPNVSQNNRFPAVPSNNRHVPQTDAQRVNTHSTPQHRPSGEPPNTTQPSHQRSPPYHQIILHPSSPHQLSPLQVNAAQFSPQQRSIKPMNGQPVNEPNNRHLGSSVNGGSPPVQASPMRVSPPLAVGQQSYGLALRPMPGALHPSPPPPSTPPGAQDRAAPATLNDQGPNQPLEILPSGNAQLSWNLDSSFQSTV